MIQPRLAPCRTARRRAARLVFSPPGTVAGTVPVPPGAAWALAFKARP